jgi:MFS family permease
VTAAPAVRIGRPALLVAVLCGVQFLCVVDSLAVALALSAIAADFRLSGPASAWVVTATSVALAGGMLIAGRLSDLRGRRPPFVAGLALLTAGALLAGLAPGPAALLAGRVLQGLGAALAYPSSLALISESFPADPWRSRAFAGSAVAGAAASILGAGFGGIVTGTLGWRWVFGLTVPVGIALAVAGLRVLPPDPPRRSGSLDLPGALLATAAVTAVVAAPTGAPLLLVAAAAAIAGLVVRERRAADPLLPPGLLREPRLLGGCLGIAASSAVYSAVAVTGGRQLQEQLGLSPVRAGLALLPVGAGIVLAGVLAVTPLRHRFGSVAVATGGLLAGAAGLAWLALSPPRLPALLGPLLLVGAALAASSTGLKEHTLGGGPDSRRGVAAAVFEASTHVGGAVSVAVYAVAVTAGWGVAHAAGAAFGLAGAVAVATLQGLRGRASAPGPRRRAGRRTPPRAGRRPGP